MKPGEVEGGVGDVDVGCAHGEDRSACLQVTLSKPKNDDTTASKTLHTEAR